MRFQSVALFISHWVMTEKRVPLEMRYRTSAVHCLAEEWIERSKLVQHATSRRTDNSISKKCGIIHEFSDDSP